MKCPICRCSVDSKTDWRMTIILILLIFIIGIGIGWNAFYLQVKPLLINQIKKDGEIKKELREGYLPPKVDPRGKQGAIK